MTTETPTHIVSPFNGPVEIGLRALCVLTTAFPAAYALQRLVVFDYFLVHSDDIEGGPEGLHPRTPHRGGEILVRRGAIQDGLTLYGSRGLIERVYKGGGIFFASNTAIGDARLGVSMTLLSFTAVVLGGVSTFGGRGTFVGGAVGAAVLAMTSSAFSFLDYPPQAELYLTGGLTLVAIGLFSRIRVGGSAS